MSRSLVLHPQALADLNDVRRYYDQQRRGLGDRFADRVVTVIELVMENPLMFARELDNIRRAPAFPFPYHLYYEPLPSQILVLGVYDARRDPRAILHHLAARKQRL